MQNSKKLAEKLALSLEGPMVVVQFSEDPETPTLLNGTQNNNSIAKLYFCVDVDFYSRIVILPEGIEHFFFQADETRIVMEIFIHQSSSVNDDDFGKRRFHLFDSLRPFRPSMPGHLHQEGGIRINIFNPAGRGNWAADTEGTQFFFQDFGCLVTGPLREKGSLNEGKEKG